MMFCLYAVCTDGRHVSQVTTLIRIYLVPVAVASMPLAREVIAPNNNVPE